MENFSDVYENLFDYIYKYVAIRSQDKEAARDITSQTFLTAFEKRSKYDSEKGSWRQWLTGIAKNQLLMHWKSKKISISLDELEAADLLIEGDNQAHKKLEANIQFRKIMDSVPENIRKLLILRYVDDLPYDDIAEITGKNSAAIRKCFSRIHKKLSEKFNHAS